MGLYFQYCEKCGILGCCMTNLDNGYCCGDCVQGNYYGKTQEEIFDILDKYVDGQNISIYLHCCMMLDEFCLKKFGNSHKFDKIATHNRTGTKYKIVNKKSMPYTVSVDSVEVVFWNSINYIINNANNIKGKKVLFKKHVEFVNIFLR